MAFQKIIRVVTIRNTGRQPLPINVDPVDEVILLGTDLTPFDGSPFFDGEGTIRLHPGRSFDIEEYRVNLGQIQNYIDSRQAHVIFSDRLFSFDGTDESEEN